MASTKQQFKICVSFGTVSLPIILQVQRWENVASLAFPALANKFFLGETRYYFSNTGIVDILVT